MQGFNMGRYVPPDLEGTTSFNTASGKGHALGRRAHKLKSEGVLIVRFECPFAIWCTTCQPEQIIGQGVRFNAEKKAVDKYYSTTIWSFRFKHSVCGGWIEVRTDPKNSEYVVVEGGRRRDYGPALDGGFWGVTDPKENEFLNTSITEEEKERLERDGGFGSLEKTIADKKVLDSNRKRLDQLTDLSRKHWQDPYTQSQRLRAEFRIGRRQRQSDEKTGDILKTKYGLAVDLLPETNEDVQRAKLIEYGALEDSTEQETRRMAGSMLDSSTTKSQTDIDETANKQKRIVSSAQRMIEQKSDLQHRLRGNTRGALDPFLRDGKQWDRKPKRKRGFDEVDDEVNNGPSTSLAAVDVEENNASSTSNQNSALVVYESD